LPTIAVKVNLVSKIYGAVVLVVQLVRWMRTIFAAAINFARSMGSMIKRGGQTLSVAVKEVVA
jgi:hypothetical protein